MRHRLIRTLRRLRLIACPECSTPGYFAEEPCEDCTFFGEPKCICMWVKVCMTCTRSRSRAARQTAQ